MNVMEICESCRAHGCDRNIEKDGTEINLCYGCPVGMYDYWFAHDKEVE